MSIEVAIVGGGIMGRGIALALAGAGHAVTVVEAEVAAAASLLERLAAELRDHTGSLEESSESILHRIRVTAALADAVAGAALVIEAVPERMELKEVLWRELGAACAPGTILASNTSALDIDALAALVEHPERVLGTHWFNPAHVIACVEIVRGSATSQEVVDVVAAILKQAGKSPIVVKNSPGFVANRIQFVLVREAMLCLEEGLASAADIDEIVSSSFGIRLAVLGPLANADLGGLDTYRSILEFLSARLGERFAVPAVLEELVSAGRLGVKTGAGIGEYSDEQAAALVQRRDTTLRRVITAVKQEEGSQ